MFQIGEKFGDYEVIQILGAGGMGQVYKVRNVLSDRFEAMKVLLPNLEQHADLADRFLREIKVQATLHHPNIAGLHTATRQGDRILMFIEYVDGMTLDKALQRGPLGPDLASNIIGQVLDALAYAHARGVVHRDIKPENIMVQPDGVVKLMDFGIARLAQDRRLTSTGRTVGSLYYMSPEQIRGADDLDGRSDLYSLGITLYQAVTGKRPFDGDSDYSIMAAHIQQNPPPPIQLDPRVPTALNDVIMMAIAKDRAARFQSAEAFRAALSGNSGAAAAATAPTPAPPPPTPHVATMPMPAPARPTPTAVMPPPPPPAPHQQAYAPPPPPPPPAQSGGSSSKGMWIGLAVLVLAGLGGVAAMKGPEWFGGSKPPVTPPETSTTTKPVVEPKQQPVEGKPSDPQPVVTTPVVATGSSGATATVPPVTGAKDKPGRPQLPAATTTTASTTPTQQPSSSSQQQPAGVTQPQQQRPQVSNSYQAEPPPQQQRPQVDPQVAREMEELRQKFNTLSIRFASAEESVRRLEAAQQRQGVGGIRRDIREAVGRFQYLMKESSDSMVNKNPEAARLNLQMAEKNLERLEKFLNIN